MKTFAKVESLFQELPTLSPGNRTIQKIVLHHTWSPNHTEWVGDSSAEGIVKYWLTQTKQLGWQNPLGGHFIVSPQGKVYVPFGDLSVSVNANSNLDVNHHGIAIETVGNFDTGHDKLVDPQRHAVIGLIAGLCVRFRLNEENVFFHRSFEDYKTCPGTSLDLHEIRTAVANAIPWARNLIKPIE